ncbi:CHAP domain-containing protein, partial [Enemella dayhoffiae]
YCGLRDGGCAQNFERGWMAWSPATGAHPVWGAILGPYGTVGYEAGALGYPISGEYCGLRDGGCAQNFQNGPVAWSLGTGAHPVRGAILGAYAGQGYEAGHLGYPVSSEYCGLRDGGCAQNFQNGPVAWSFGTGAHPVRGAILGSYAGQGFEAGPIGYPVGGEYCGLRDGGCAQNFQNGPVAWSPGTGAHPVRGAILGEYAAQGYEAGRLGYPVGDEFPDGGHAVQFFQGGEVRWDFAARRIVPPGIPVVGGNYPESSIGSITSRGFAARYCTDFAAWRRGMVWSQINSGGDGNARAWRDGWVQRGRPVSNVPKVGAIAWWGTSRGGGYGHVGIVVGVNPDGSAAVEHYNFEVRNGYSVTPSIRAEAYLY